MSQPAAIEFEGICKDYPGGFLGRSKLRALDDVTFRVEAGEVVGLIGPNRAGKTTLVKILLSLTRSTAGRVGRLGRPGADRRTLARVGYMHENHAFPRYWTAAGLLRYYGALTLLADAEVRRRAPDLLKQVGLADRAREPIARFSKGMIQRLGLAQALLNDPDLLVLDEPTEGLDLLGRQLLRDVITQRRQRGQTTLLVSHDLEEVEALCGRVAVLVGGQLVHLGTLAELPGPSSSGTPRPLDKTLRTLYRKALA